jgi:5-methylcytosine-specific restriction endonuclease McrA
LELLLIIAVIIVAVVIIKSSRSSRSRPAPSQTFTPRPPGKGRSRGRRTWVSYPPKPYDWRKIAERDGLACQLCGHDVDPANFSKRRDGTFKPGNRYPTVDHIQPRSLGGGHEDANLRLAHFSCNAQRGNREHIEDTCYPELPFGNNQYPKPLKPRATDAHIEVVAAAAIRAAANSSDGEFTYSVLWAEIVEGTEGRVMPEGTARGYISVILNADSARCTRPLVQRGSRRGTYKLITEEPSDR